MNSKESKFTHKLDGNEISNAQRHWFDLYEIGWKSFWGFIGYDNVSKYATHGTEEAYRKIQMLSSPHYKTLMAAFIAKTGYHRKLPKK